MKVFISWSGDKSKELGEVFRNWLPSVLQAVKPYFTPEDIEKGARWSQDISKELENSFFGIICLTRDNVLKPWIMFEAGALSKSFGKGRVCPILFGLEKSDIQGPLVQFQATSFNKSDMKKLIENINKNHPENSLEKSVLDNVFDLWWPMLEKEVSEIQKSYEESRDEEDLRTDRDILEEVLELSRNLNRPRIARKDLDERAINDIVRRFEKLLFDPSISEEDIQLNMRLRSLWRPIQYLASRLKHPRYSEYIEKRSTIIKMKLNENLRDSEDESE